MLNDFTTWLLVLIGDLFTSIWDFIADSFIYVFDLLVNAFVTVIAAIPVPTFLANGLQSLFSNLDPTIMYAVTALGLPACLAVIGLGYGFRLARKFATLFQW